MYNAMKIGEAREYIERKRNLNKREKAILLTSILLQWIRLQILLDTMIRIGKIGHDRTNPF